MKDISALTQCQSVSAPVSVGLPACPSMDRRRSVEKRRNSELLEELLDVGLVGKTPRVFPRTPYCTKRIHRIASVSVSPGFISPRRRACGISSVHQPNIGCHVAGSLCVECIFQVS